MDVKTPIRQSLNLSSRILQSYIEDLSDAELLHRPCPGGNHINWQLGHLIASENKMINGAIPGSMPALPAGFAEKYASDNAGVDDPKQLCTKQELLSIHKQQREATLATLAKQSEKDLDKEAPEAYKAYAPNFGALFAMQDAHWMMHAGQWAIIRRQLGRKPMF